jgi:hypothetical protein
MRIAMATAPQLETPGYSPQAKAARRRAVLAVSAIGLFLLILWLGDTIASRLPAPAYQPSQHQAGAFSATVTFDPAQPSAGKVVMAHIKVTNTAHAPVSGATVTYTWAMVTMDMGTAQGTAKPAATPGQYDAQLTPLMNGYWRLTLHIHAANQPDATIPVDIPVQP